MAAGVSTAAQIPQAGQANSVRTRLTFPLTVPPATHKRRRFGTQMQGEALGPLPLRRLTITEVLNHAMRRETKTVPTDVLDAALAP